MTTHLGTPSPSSLDSATTAASVPDLAGLDALGESLPVPGWERGGGSDRTAAGKSGESTRAPANQGGDDYKAAQVSPSALFCSTKPSMCVRPWGWEIAAQMVIPPGRAEIASPRRRPTSQSCKMGGSGNGRSYLPLRLRRPSHTRPRPHP